MHAKDAGRDSRTAAVELEVVLLREFPHGPANQGRIVLEGGVGIETS